MNNTMFSLRAFVIIAVCFLVVTGMQAQGKKGDMPASGFRADLAGQINYVQKQIMDLEDAVPADKFSWRPAEGVRSIGEVYLHIAFGNYIIMKLSGYEPPAEANFSMDMKKWDSQSTDKAKIAGIMKDSFHHLHSILNKMSDADLEKKVNLFGTEMTLRSATMSLLSHLHEHLGQSIAYSRMNNIVPPWTVSEQKASGKK